MTRAGGGARGSRAARLDALLRAALPKGVAGGLARVAGAEGAREVAFRPATLAQEPGFLAYSATKTMIAALALSLQEEGRLDLDEPVARLLPEPALAAQPGITLRRLLQHTAGVPDYGGLAAYHEAVRRSPGTPWTDDDFAARSWRRGLLAEPGSGFVYSNPGYLLVRRALEAAGGRGLAALVEERIARPLGLERTFVAAGLDDLHRLAPARSRAVSADGRPHDVRGVYHPGWVSHGVVASTPSELAAFVHALFTGRLLADASRAQLTALVPVPRGAAGPQWREPSYGLGVMADPASPLGPLFGHNGSGPAYSASVFTAPARGAGGVTACAMLALEDEALAERLVREALADAPAPGPAAPPA